MVSVVIPTHNRSRHLEHTILSVAEQDKAPTDIVVVDNASTDDTEAVVRKLAKQVRRLRYVHEPQLGVSFARNRGAAEAGSDLVAFIDDDAVASRDWLAALATGPVRQPGVTAVAGPIALRWPVEEPAWVIGLEGWYGQYDLGDEPRPIVYPDYPFGSNLAMRREALLSIGGFPTELGPRGTVRISNEEDGLFRRVAEQGWTVTYEPSALVYHLVHRDRLSRRYLLRRAFMHGQSDVLSDDLAAPSRSRRQEAARAATALGRAAVAARIAAANRSRMGALVETSVELGRATRRAAFAVRGPATAASRETQPPSRPLGLTPAQLAQFARDGFVHITGAFAGADLMEDCLWRFFARRGVERHEPRTWPSGEARHLQKLLRDPVFVPIGGARTTAAIDALLGRGTWDRPNHWGELLVTFPSSEPPWHVPTLWHTDVEFDEPIDPPSGVMVFSFLNRVPHRHGGTLVVAGSHRLVARYAAHHPDEVSARRGVARRHFFGSHPWLAHLLVDPDEPSRWDRLSREVDIDGLPARVVELTGEPGDIVITHPLLVHCISPNAGTQPRFMRISRPRVRDRLTSGAAAVR